MDDISAEYLIQPSLNPAWNIALMFYQMSFAQRKPRSNAPIIRNFKWVPKLQYGLFNFLNIHIIRRGTRNVSKESLVKVYYQAYTNSIQSLDIVNDEEWDFTVNYPARDPLLARYFIVERLFNFIKLHFESHQGDIREALSIHSERSSSESAHGSHNR